MNRIHFLVTGLALALGMALAWGAGARPHENAGKTQELLENMQLRQTALGLEIKELCQEVKTLKGASRQTGATGLAKDSPPGRITEIDAADSTLVEIDLGAEAGLEKHATLEVFRTGAAEEYVGALRIFEVYSRRAVCRLLSTNPLTKPTVHVGDCVRCQRN